MPSDDDASFDAFVRTTGQRLLSAARRRWTAEIATDTLPEPAVDDGIDDTLLDGDASGDAGPPLNAAPQQNSELTDRDEVGRDG